VLTAEHVVFEGVRIRGQVGDTGPTYDAALIGVDAANDVALLQLQHASGLRTAMLGDPSRAHVGDQAAFIGYTGAGGPSVVRGRITRLHATLTEGVSGDRPEVVVHNQIVADANAIHGQSGGPLVDASGRVIGMTTVRWTSHAGVFGAATSID